MNTYYVLYPLLTYVGRFYIDPNFSLPFSARLVISNLLKAIVFQLLYISFVLLRRTIYVLVGYSQNCYDFYLCMLQCC